MNRTFLLLSLGLVLLATSSPARTRRLTCRMACRKAIAKCVHTCLVNTHGIPGAGRGCRTGCHVTLFNTCKTAGTDACIQLGQ